MSDKFQILKDMVREYNPDDMSLEEYAVKLANDYSKVCKSNCKLQQENQQLKDELEVSKQYEDYYKDLCDKALKTGGKYISVIKEIREYIVDDIQHCTYGQVPKYQDILQILDKVSKE